MRKFKMETWLLFEVGKSTQIEVPCVVEFSYSPGAPETPPSYHHGGLPADPPECEISMILLEFPGMPPLGMDPQMQELLFSDVELITQCCDYAAEAMADEKAEATERRAEARRDDADDLR